MPSSCKCNKNEAPYTTAGCKKHTVSSLYPVRNDIPEKEGRGTARQLLNPPNRLSGIKLFHSTSHEISNTSAHTRTHVQRWDYSQIWLPAIKRFASIQLNMKIYS